MFLCIVYTLLVTIDITIKLNVITYVSIPTVPGENLVEGIKVTRINEGRAANISWPVLPVDQVGSIAHFVINYSQAGRKRQSGDQSVECTGSGCRVPYEQGSVIVSGLNPDLTFTFNIMAVNEEGEQGNAVMFTSKR